MIEKIRKVGIMTKGFVYILVGILTLLAALNIGGKIAGKNGVINFLQNQTFGQTLLILTGIGLLAYSVWRLCSAFLDSKNEGSDKKGKVKRTAYFFSGLAYAALGISTLRGAFGQMSNSGGESRAMLASSVLNESWGDVALYIVAIILLGVGLYQFRKGLKKEFLEDIDNRGEVESQEVLEKAGRFGFIARGISFLVFAWFVFKAASLENASEVRGLQGVFTFIQDMPMGNILLALMAIGFVAYGVYQYFLARYSNLYAGS